MSVEISPSNQIGFPRPLTQLVKRSILIHNPHPHPVAFKVKTTAPKQYCVRPNSGRVESGESVEVQVLLQPLATEPPPHAKCKDKFLVQSAFITPDEEMRTLSEMWSQTEKTNKTAIQEHKLRVVYIAAEDSANGIPEENEDMEQSRIEESANMPNDGMGRWTTAKEKAVDPSLFRNGGLTYWEVEEEPFKPKTSAIFAPAHSSPTTATPNGKDRSITPPSATSVAPPIVGLATAKDSVDSTPTRTNEPQLPALTTADINKTDVSPSNASLEQSLATSSTDSDKLKIALKEIDRLRSELDEARGPQAAGLRKRGGPGASSSASGAEIAVEKAKEVIHGNQGVPIEVVAGLVVAVFVMTYMFF